MKKLVWMLVIIGTVLLAGGYFNRSYCLSDADPQVAVRNYLIALQDQRFEDAFPLLTANMTDGKAVTEWVEQQRKMFEIGKVVIEEIDVKGGHRELKNLYTCAGISLVPNVLRASDMLNIQASIEYEVYRVILDEGVWKIDSQETLFDETMIDKWFPGTKIPDYETDRPTT